MTAYVFASEATGSARPRPVSVGRAPAWALPVRFRAAALLVLLIGLCGAYPARAQTGAEARPLVCRMGVNVEDLYELDMANDAFGAILWVWAVCPAAAPDPLPTLGYATAATGLAMGPIETVDQPTGERYSSQRVQGKFRYNWNMTHYPFDRQRIVILLDETYQDADNLVFEPDTRESFLSPEIRDHLSEWTISDLTVTSRITDEASTYGQPGVERSRYAELEVAFTMDRAQFLTFLKLTAGVYAAVFIAFLSFFHDANDRGSFGSKLGLLVGVLFAVLINMRTVDTTIGDIGYMTLVTRIHLWTLMLIVVLALIALRDRLRSEGGTRIRHPDWPTLITTGTIYLLGLAAMIIHAARS
jgi:hypothetical protein